METGGKFFSSGLVGMIVSGIIHSLFPPLIPEPMIPDYKGNDNIY